MNALFFSLNDGGRFDAGFRGRTGDCSTRAIAIATGLSYRTVYDTLADLYSTMTGGLFRTARNGMPTPVSHAFLMDRGAVLTVCERGATLLDIPYRGCYVAHIRTGCGPHLVAVVNGTVFDSWDSRYGKARGFPGLTGFYRLPMPRKPPTAQMPRVVELLIETAMEAA